MHFLHFQKKCVFLFIADNNLFQTSRNIAVEDCGQLLDGSHVASYHCAIICAPHKNNTSVGDGVDVVGRPRVGDFVGELIVAQVGHASNQSVQSLNSCVVAHFHSSHGRYLLCCLVCTCIIARVSGFVNTFSQIILQKFIFLGPVL